MRSPSTPAAFRRPEPDLQARTADFRSDQRHAVKLSLTNCTHVEPAAALYWRLLEMLIEITTAIFLIQGAHILSRLIERRRDVFYYLSKPYDGR